MLNQSRKKEESYLILIILMVIFRLVISLMKPYAIDMGGYLAWSRYLADNGPSGLYSRFHIVYAPFYQYFLWISGLISRSLGLSAFFHTLLIKLWSVLFEGLGALIIFRMAERAGRRSIGFLAASFYLLNPGVLFNSFLSGASLTLYQLPCFWLSYSYLNLISEMRRLSFSCGCPHQAPERIACSYGVIPIFQGL